ncbi:hypothetical protein B0I35DRAFT_412091 [Stachybotrys elegans]|uniref:Small secreted protein n=1 Tax=Stachybotrys elegans TaxID=80388 RepID=A0A8K0SHW8_9HYPO|nr:hypothetical protein B0I35DRAFT_412091 [Stachybotrys elegans]
MLFTQSLVAAFASIALAAPTRLMTVDEEWTIESLQRVCDEQDTQCTWTFTINTNTEGVEPTSVEYIVEASGETPASQAIGGPSEFGVFTVTSTWSDVFGIEDAWTTMSVIDFERGILVYPAYLDRQVAGGEVVEPDQVYIPEPIPA